LLSFLHLRFLRRVLDCVDDVRVTSATAEIAVERVPNLVTRRRPVPLEKLNDGHNHARCAIATLKAVALPEAFLNAMQFPILREAFDGRDLCAISLDGEHRTGFDRLPIDEDGAGATDAGLTSHVRPGKAAYLTQKLDEQ
jgi:hypothetical protein